MTQEIFDKKFKELFIAYSLDGLDEKQQMNLLENTLFYGRQDEYFMDELKTLHKILVLHIYDDTKRSFFTIFRRLYNSNNWEIERTDDLGDEEYNYLFVRDTNVLVLYYMFCAYSLILNPIDVPITAKMALKRARLRRDELIDKGINHINDELFTRLTNMQIFAIE